MYVDLRLPDLHSLNSYVSCQPRAKKLSGLIETIPVSVLNIMRWSDLFLLMKRLCKLNSSALSAPIVIPKSSQHHLMSETIANIFSKTNLSLLPSKDWKLLFHSILYSAVAYVFFQHLNAFPILSRLVQVSISQCMRLSHLHHPYQRCSTPRSHAATLGSTCDSARWCVRVQE